MKSLGTTGRLILSVISLAALSLLQPAAAYAQPESISGRLIEQIVDYPDHRSDTIFYLELKSGQRVRLDLSAVSTLSRESLKTGAELVLIGEYVAGTELKFRAASAAGFQAAPAVAADGVVGGQVVSGTRRAVAITLNLQNAGATYSVPAVCTNGQVAGYLYDNAQSMRAIYETSSRNQLTFNRDVDSNGAADVFGPYTILANPGSCDYSTWAALADAAAISAGVDLSAYQHKIYVLPNYDDIGCSWAGLGDLSCGNSCKSWVAYCFSTITYTHEIGHNLGLHHAGTDNNNDGVNEDQYNDMSCPMGYATLTSYIFNAPHEDQMGWFDSNPSKAQVVSADGTFDIGPLERSSGATPYPQMLKILAGSQDYYYISYRRQEAPIDQLNGVYANKVSVHRFKNTSGQQTRLLSLLNDGQSFSDNGLGLVATMNSHDADKASVTVSFPSQSTDTDGDGLTDYVESQDGTNRNDPGSYLNHLSSPVYLLWNGFLGMVNIAELINPSSDPSSNTTMTISLYSISGQLMHTQALNLTGGQQFDLILNQLPGFIADSYGIVKITYTGSLEGRVSYYRPVGAEYEFAYSIPLNQPLLGTSGVGFNTFQPSTNPSQLSFSVYNWLSLINLSNSTETFTINTYNQGGSLLASRQVSVPSFGRADVDGGHVMAGAGVVGLHEIVPQSGTTPYLAQLIRYGANSGPGSPPSGYFFAFPLSAHPGNGQRVALPTSRQFGESNWVEVANIKNAPINVNITFYNEDGVGAGTSFQLAAHSQLHFPVDDQRLANSTRGFVEIDSDTINSLIAQSMFYYRDSAGGIRAMYGIEQREPLGVGFNGSYNLFLGMENWLSLSSTGNQWVTATVKTVGPGGGSQQYFSVPPSSTIVLPIHSAAQFNTQSDSYGFVNVTPDQPNSIIADLIRTRRPAGVFDFAFPTAVRP